jgi:hypothetical protein
LRLLFLFPPFARPNLFFLAFAILLRYFQLPAAFVIGGGAGSVTLAAATEGVNIVRQPPVLSAFLSLGPLARKRPAAGCISRRPRFVAPLQAKAMICRRDMGGRYVLPRLRR